MKQMKRLFFAIASLALILSGCQEEENTFKMTDEVSSFNQITVSLDDFANTRVHFNDAKKVVWNENDTIGVYSDTDGIVPFVYLSDNTFTSNQTVKGNQFYAFYPYSNWPFNWIYMRPITVDDSNILHIYMPEGNVRELWDRQDVISSIWKNTIPMVAKSADNHFSFKQTMGVLHFTVKNIAQITGVVVVSNNKEPMYGFASIDMSATNPILSLDEIDGYGGYGLSYKYDNVKLEEGETIDAYIPVPVGTYSKGFTVTINGLNANGESVKIIKSTDNSLTVNRASMSSYTELDFDGILSAEQAKEREALIAIYHALDGDNWINNTNWCSEKPISEWYGVAMRDGHVYDINNALNDNNVHGDMPAEIGELSYMNSIILQSFYNEPNGITSLPKEIGKLSQLFAIYLTNAQITSLPDEIGNLKNLHYMQIFNTPIKSLPQGIGGCSGLFQLMMVNTDLESMPAEIANLEALKTVELTGNKLTAFPEGLANNRHFTSLSMNESGITELPATIGNMANLTSLKIGGYNLAGNLPSEISNLTNLTSLTINGTQMTGSLPSEMGMMKALQILDLSDNQFTGTIPASFANLSKLSGLNIKGNMMNGEISKTILNSEMWANLPSTNINPQKDGYRLTFEGGEIPVSRITLDVTTCYAGIQCYVGFNTNFTSNYDTNIKVTIEPSNATNKNLIVEIPDYSSWETTKVRVDYNNSGQIILQGGRLPGKETITIRAEGSDATATLEVINSGVAFDKPVYTMNVGETLTLGYTNYCNSDDKILWTSYNKDIVTIDENGTVTAVGEGTADISAHSMRGGLFHIDIQVGN